MIPLLAAEDLSIRRGHRMLVDGLGLALAAGDALLVRGRNGAGKSTLLRVLAGLVRADAGRVRAQARIALVDDRAALDEALPLADALGFWARIDGHAAPLDRVGLAGLEAVPVAYLSTGQRRRATLARLLAADAPVWLLDEPEAGLDKEGAALLAGLVAERRATGGCVVVATHAAHDGVPGARTLRLG